mgnify:CR=1 FL=1
MKFSIDLKDKDIETLIHNHLSKNVSEVVDEKLREIVDSIIDKKVERGIDLRIPVVARQEIQRAVTQKFVEVYGLDWSGKITMKKHFDKIALDLIKSSIQ